MAVAQKRASLTKTMTSGSEFTIRLANAEDISAIKALVDQHKVELGFVIKSALLTSITRSELAIAVLKSGKLVGMVHYRHRKDGQTTLYSIVVDPVYRRQQIARTLVVYLRNSALARGQAFIALKCPEGLPANQFYHALGFELTGRESGKLRPLILWKLSLST